jgi:anti-anti-sigma regulatory factor
VTVPVSRIGVDRIDADIAVVDVLGEHDLTTAAELRERLDALLGEGLGIAVDLSETTFLDVTVAPDRAGAVEAARSGGE